MALPTMDELNVDLLNAINTNTVQSQDMFAAGLQSTPGMSPFLAAQAQGNYNALASQGGSANYDALSSRGNLQYQTFNNEMDLQNKIAQQQIDVQHASSNAKFFGSLAGSMAGLAFASKTEGKAPVEGLSFTLNPEDAKSDEVQQRNLEAFSAGVEQDLGVDEQKAATKELMDAAGQTLANSASAYERIPGTEGFDGGGVNVGTNADELATNPQTEKMVEKDENGEVKGVKVPEATSMLLGVVGNQHDTIQSMQAQIAKLSELVGLKSEDAPKSETDAVNKAGELGKNYSTQNEALFKGYSSAQKKIQEEQTDEAENLFAIQQQREAENAAYTARRNAISAKYPALSYEDIQSNMSATQQVLKAFAFIAGGVSQGLTGARENPGAAAYYKSLDNMIKTSQVNYDRAIRDVELTHGDTLDGLTAKTAVTRDYLKIIDGQKVDLQNAYANASSTLKNNFEASRLAQTTFESMSKLSLQRKAYDTQLLNARAQLNATLTQAKENPYAVAIGVQGMPQYMNAYSEKAQEKLNTELPPLNAKIASLQRLSSALVDKNKNLNMQDVDRIAAEFQQLTGGKAEEFEKLYTKKGLFTNNVAGATRLSNAIKDAIKDGEITRKYLISQNAYSTDYNKPSNTSAVQDTQYDEDEIMDSSGQNNQNTSYLHSFFGAAISLLNFALGENPFDGEGSEK